MFCEPVKQTSLNISLDGPYVINTDVYQLKVSVLSTDGAPVQGAYAIAYTQSDVGYGFDITNSSGIAIFKLPTGVYDIDVHYVGSYWLSLVTTNAMDSSVPVNSSTTRVIVLTGFPPSFLDDLGIRPSNSHHNSDNPYLCSSVDA